MDENCEDVPVFNQPVKLAYIWLNSFGISPEIAKKIMHTDFSYCTHTAQLYAKTL